MNTLFYCIITAILTFMLTAVAFHLKTRSELEALHAFMSEYNEVSAAADHVGLMIKVQQLEQEKSLMTVEHYGRLNECRSRLKSH